MGKYIFKRFIYMLISLFIIITITFFLMKLMPGSPFNDAKLNAEQKEILNEKYGLNDPVATQYLHYLKNVVTGDFGNSFQYHNQPVWDLIKPRLLPSFEMGLTAMFIGMILGLILGVAAATKQNSWVDYTTTVISVIAVSVPSFVLAVLLQYVFAMVPSSWMGRFFDRGITVTCIICSCFSNCRQIHKSRDDRGIKFRLHFISES